MRLSKLLYYHLYESTDFSKGPPNDICIYLEYLRFLGCNYGLDFILVKVVGSTKSIHSSYRFSWQSGNNNFQNLHERSWDFFLLFFFFFFFLSFIFSRSSSPSEVWFKCYFGSSQRYWHLQMFLLNIWCNGKLANI